LPQHGTPSYEVSWTLEREVVFYALAAIIVPIAGIPGLAVVLGGLAFAGFWYGNPWSYHLVSTIQADFLSGVLMFMVSRHVRLNLPACVTAICVGCVALWYTRQHEFAFSATASL